MTASLSPRREPQMSSGLRSLGLPYCREILPAETRRCLPTRGSRADSTGGDVSDFKQGPTSSSASASSWA